MRDLLNHPDLLIVIVITVGSLIARALKRSQQPAPLPAPPPEPYPGPMPGSDPGAPEPYPGPAWPEEAARWASQDELAPRLSALEARAAELAGSVRHERATRRFAGTLAEWVPEQAARLRAALARAPATGVPELAAEVATLELVVDEIALLVRQRRDPGRLARLGDADALAAACYQPVMRWARSRGLPLTSNVPATQVGDYDLAIWTGFIPTSIAPIFLPADFFATTVWWPAVAHEIGHDFLASVTGLDERLRRDLQLASARVGSRPLVLDAEGLRTSEVERVFGAWFEEIFCDVFGTMMCGPAYVAAMTELFQSRHRPRDVLLVEIDGSGRRYGPHPPRHLRVVLACMVLDRNGFHQHASDLRAAWEEAHPFEGGAPDRLLFPTGYGLLGLPLGAFEELGRPIVERLVAGPLPALGGTGLAGISGLDYGPREHADAERALEALVAGRVPAVRDPRAVMSGAVLAALAEPERDREVLERARAAIPAVGTSEVRPDAYQPAAACRPAALRGRGWLGPAAVREAVILREVLRRPRRLP